MKMDLGLGQFPPEGSQSVVLASNHPAISNVGISSISAGENHLGEVGGNMSRVSVELTRPADTTAYAANDVVADSTSAAAFWPGPGRSNWYG